MSERKSRAARRHAFSKSGSSFWRRAASYVAFVLGALSLTLIPAQVWSAGSASVAIGATVLSKNNCVFRNSGSATLAFGNIDPSSGSNATAAASLTIRCGGASSLVSYALIHDSGLYETAVNANRMKHATLSEYIPYAFVLTPSSGSMPKNTDQVINITGTITRTDFQNAMMGGYSDTVLVTVNP